MACPTDHIGLLPEESHAEDSNETGLVIVWSAGGRYRSIGYIRLSDSFVWQTRGREGSTVMVPGNDGSDCKNLSAASSPGDSLLMPTGWRLAPVGLQRSATSESVSGGSTMSQ